MLVLCWLELHAEYSEGLRAACDDRLHSVNVDEDPSFSCAIRCRSIRWRRAAALGSHAGMDGSGDATGLPNVFAIRLPPMHRVCVRVQTRTASAARGDPRREQLNRRSVGPCSSLNHDSTRVTGGRMPAFERGLQRICASLCWAVSQRAHCAPCSLLSRRPLRLVEAPNIPHCPNGVSRQCNAMQGNARLFGCGWIRANWPGDWIKVPCHRLL